MTIAAAWVLKDNARSPISHKVFESCLVLCMINLLHLIYLIIMQQILSFGWFLLCEIEDKHSRDFLFLLRAKQQQQKLQSHTNRCTDFYIFFFISYYPSCGCEERFYFLLIKIKANGHVLILINQ